jgi:DNA-binding GntR family transcriptional regulator
MTHNRTGNAQELVYKTLRDSILSLNLLPGTAISENEISLRFEVSRTPVREAFIALSKEALVTVVPQKGSMVSRIDFARVEQEVFLRENLEQAALKRFVKNHDASHLAELERCIELQQQANKDQNFELFLKYDNLFHRVFFGKQQVAWEAMENMCGHYYRVRFLTIRLLEVVNDLVQQHKDLFQAVKQRDLKKSPALLESHLHKLDTEELMLKRLFPDYFVDSREAPPVVDFGGLSAMNTM